MAKIRVTSAPPARVPCGSCDGSLDVPALIRADVYDFVHELPSDLKEGTINFFRCPRNGYEAWLWPGYIAFDRKKSRGVFVTYGLEPEEAFQAALRDTLDVLAGEIGTFASAELRGRLVALDDYRHALGVLTSDDEWFEWELAASRAFEARRSIDEPEARAERFVYDLLTCPLIMFRAEEARPRFRRSVVRAFDRIIGGGLAHGERADKLREERSRIVATIQSGIDDDVTEDEPESSPRFLDIDLSDKQVVTPRLSPELRAFCEQQAGELASRLNRSRLDPEAALSDAIRLLCEKPSAVRPSESPSKALQSSASAVTDSIPDSTWVFGNAAAIDSTVLVARATGGDRDAIFALARAALVSIEDDPTFAATVCSFLARVARETASVEARSFACVTSAALCAVRQEFALDASLLAAAVLELYPAHDTAISAHFLNPAGVAWQRLGRWAFSIGLPYHAAQCAGESVEFFTLCGRIEGALTSKVDALEDMIEIDPAGIDPRIVDELTTELDGFEPDGRAQTSVVQRQRARVRVLRGLCARARTSAKPAVLTLKYKGLSSGRIPLLAPLDVSNDASEPGLMAAGDGVPETFVTLGVMESQTEGTQVIVAAFRGVAWATAFLEAMAIAGAGHEWAIWTNAVAHLIESSRPLACPELDVYLCRYLREQTEKEGMPGGLIEQTMVPLLEARATAMTLLAAGKDPNQNAAFRAFVASLEAQVEQACRTLREPISPEAQQVRDADWLLMAGDVLELARSYRMAHDAHIRSAQLILAIDPQGTVAKHTRRLRVGVARAASRASKALVREVSNGSGRGTADLIEALELMELIKAPSLRRLKDEGGTRTAPGALPLSDLLPVRFSELKELLPPNAAILTLSLLHSTQLSPGFWSIALALPHHDGKILIYPTSFDIVHPAHLALKSVLGRCSASVVDKSPSEAAEALRVYDAETFEALAGLADALLPEPLADLLEDFGIETLYVIPEAYLFDTPWAALRVKTRRGRTYLHAAGAQGRLAINVLPSWSVLARTWHRAPGLPREPSGIGAGLVDRPAWRGNRILGVRPRFEAALRRYVAASGPAPAPVNLINVSDFLRCFRENRLMVFFGHGEVTPEHGARLIANDGPIDAATVKASASALSFDCEAAFLLTCSGLSSVAEELFLEREIDGAHIELVRGGVRFIVGSSTPLFAAVAIKVLEDLLDPEHRDLRLDLRLATVHATFANHSQLAHPVFWGALAGFGDGAFALQNGNDEERAAAS